MNILITGGAGFIGSSFLRHMLHKAAINVSEIRVLDALTYSGTVLNFHGLDSKTFQFIRGDIRDKALVKKCTEGVDAVIHFAAESHVDRSIHSSRIFIETNVLGTETLLEASLKNQVGIFLHVSTDEVYGSIDIGSWNEDYPLRPNSPYAASKASSDLVALAFHRTHGLDVRITRCSNNYGPRQFPEKIIPLFITNILTGKKVPLYGEGKNVRDWLHVQDHCDAIELVLAKGKAGEIYNIGGGKELTNKELTLFILNELGEDDSKIEFVIDRKGHDFRYSLDFSKIANDLGYKPQIPFEKGIKETISWYKRNTAWWQEISLRKTINERA